MLSQKQLAELEKAIEKQIQDERQWQGEKQGIDIYIRGYEYGMRKMLAMVRNIRGKSNE